MVGLGAIVSFVAAGLVGRGFWAAVDEMAQARVMASACENSFVRYGAPAYCKQAFDDAARSLLSKGVERTFTTWIQWPPSMMAQVYLLALLYIVGPHIAKAVAKTRKQNAGFHRLYGQPLRLKR